MPSKNIIIENDKLPSWDAFNTVIDELCVEWSSPKNKKNN